MADDPDVARRLAAAVELHARVLVAEIGAVIPSATLVSLGAAVTDIISAVTAAIPETLCRGERPAVFAFPSLDHAVTLLQRRGLAAAVPIGANYVVLSAAVSRASAWPHMDRRPLSSLEELLFSPTVVDRAAAPLDDGVPLSDTPQLFDALFRFATKGASEVFGAVFLQPLSSRADTIGSWPLRLSAQGATVTAAFADINVRVDASVLRSIASRALLSRLGTSASPRSDGATLTAHARFLVRGTAAGDAPLMQLGVRPFTVDFQPVEADSCGGDSCAIIGADVLLDEAHPAAFLWRIQLFSPQVAWVPPSLGAEQPAELPATFAPARPDDETSPFIHPGIVIDEKQLGFMRERVAAREGPMYDAYKKASTSAAGLLAEPFGPPPEGVIDCGPYSLPDYGCTAEGLDGEAALVQVCMGALL